MTSVYTKNGRPLRREGDDLFSRSGAHVARLRRDRAFDSSGKYVGTLVGDRLIYRSTHTAAVPFEGKGSYPRIHLDRLVESEANVETLLEAIGMAAT